MKLTDNEKRDAIKLIEQVDEPRPEKRKMMQLNLFDIDHRGRQLAGWTNEKMNAFLKKRIDQEAVYV